MKTTPVINKYYLLIILATWGLGKSVGYEFLTNTVFAQASDSFRMTLNFGQPRNFGTRFIKETRTLEIRISPASAKELTEIRSYDTRYIQRVLVEENKGEVFLSLQLTNYPIGWYVTPQDDPWRLTIDLFKTEAFEFAELDGWTWQKSLSSDEVFKKAASEHSVFKNVPEIYEEKLQVPQKNDALLISSSQASESRDGNSHGSSFRKDLFGRIEPFKKISEQNITKKVAQYSAKSGGAEEFEFGLALAHDYYSVGRYAEALPLYRRIAALAPVRFANDPKVLWEALESAYLSRRFEAAFDYAQLLISRHQQSEYVWLARLRLLDMLVATGEKTLDEQLPSYQQIAFSERSPWPARIVASTRVVGVQITASPEVGKNHIHHFEVCIEQDLVQDGIRLDCSYLLTRSLLPFNDVLTVHKETKRFAQLAPKDPRVSELNTLLREQARQQMKELADQKNWVKLVELESKAPAELMRTEESDSVMLFQRAEAWRATGNRIKAAPLYAQSAKLTDDEKQKSLAMVLAADGYLTAKQKTQGDLLLKQLDESEFRKQNGLSDRAMAVIKDLSLIPFKNRFAKKILMDEVATGRYVERDLYALIELSEQADIGSSIHEKVITFPARTSDEFMKIEESYLKYAEKLKSNNRLEKAAEAFMAVANLAQGTRKAEAAYKAGVMFARVGFIEKAKASWELAVSDKLDRKFSSLAAERLERIR